MISIDEDTRKEWRRFLTSPAGAVGLAHVREHNRPAPRNVGQPHEMHFDLGAQWAFDETLRKIQALGDLKPANDDAPETTPTLRPVRRQ